MAMDESTDNLALGYSRLQLHIHTPNLEDIWLDGYAQGQADYAESNNPFPDNSKEHKLWDDGWWAGFYGENPLFNDYPVEAPSAIENRAVSPATSNKKKACAKHPISLSQWLLMGGELCSGSLASFAAFQLANIVL